MMKVEEKRQIAGWIKDNLLESSASFLVDYRGLKVDEVTEFRRKLRESKASFKVVKNTLAKRGAGGADLMGLEPLFVGPTGIVFIQQDAVAVARILKRFMDEHPNLKIKGGVLSRDLIDAEKIISLASLPDRGTLLAEFLSQLNAPLITFMTALISPVQNFVFVINNIIDEKKGGASMATVPKQEVKQEVKEKKEDRKKIIIREIEQMNILELSELVKELEEKFGVKASAPQIAASAAPSVEKEAEEEKVEFDVILSEVGDKKIQVIKEIRKLTSLGLKEAKDLVESAPQPVKQGINKEEAQKMKEILETVGAKVELK
ncbi:50S ribosomal protein L7/L12 [Candidatus Aerophobetes bacterium]|nr:50S ribosomal protein L7/L12 [Candidatus Aerophobetes bacterium]